LERSRIEELRREIDAVDAFILGLLRKRMELCADVGLEKKRTSLPLTDEEREREVLSRAGALAGVFSTVVEACKEVQLKAAVEERRAGVAGIVGAGRMGSWLAAKLKRSGYEVLLYDVVRSRAESAAAKLGATAVSSLEALASSSSIVAVAIPTSETPRVLEEVLELLKRGLAQPEAVFDMATYKSGVVSIYKRFPEGVKVASVHPLFGPRATLPCKHSVAVVAVPGRELDAEAVAKIFGGMGFKTFIMLPEEHDRVFATTIGCAHLVGLALAKLAASLPGEMSFDKLNATFKYLAVYLSGVLEEDPAFLAELVLQEEVARRAEELAQELLNLSKSSPDRLAEEVLELKKRAKELGWPDDPRSIIYAVVEGALGK